MNFSWLLIWALILLTLGIILYWAVARLPVQSRKRELGDDESKSSADFDEIELRKDIEELHLNKGATIKSINLRDDAKERHLEEYSEDLSFEDLEEQKHVPWGYGDSKIVLLTKDPHWLYAYWEITDAKKEEIIRNFGNDVFVNSHPYLRIYDLTTPTKATHFDLEINEDARNWYINVANANHLYKVALGRKRPNGLFISLIESNAAITPREAMANLIDEDWPPIPEITNYYEKFVFNQVLSSPDLTKHD